MVRRKALKSIFSLKLGMLFIVGVILLLNGLAEAGSLLFFKMLEPYFLFVQPSVFSINFVSKLFRKEKQETNKLKLDEGISSSNYLV